MRWMLFAGLALAIQGAEAAETHDDAVESAPDRSEPPAVMPPMLLSIPELDLRELHPGVQLLTATVPGVRRVEVQVLARRGWRQLTPSDPMVGQAFAAVQETATQEHKADELEPLLQGIDASVTSWVGLDRSGVDLDVPLEALDEGIAVLAEVLQSPRWHGKELRRELDEATRWYDVDVYQSASAVAGWALANTWYPADHPFGLRTDLDGWRRVSKGRLKRMHRDQALAPTVVLVIGDVSGQVMADKLRAALDGFGAPGDAPEPASFAPPTEAALIAVDMPGAEQVQLRLRMAAPTLNDADRGAFALVNWALGGHFLSRLQRNLREERGLTYGVSSRYSPAETRGSINVRTEVATADAEQAIRQIEAEVARLAEHGLEQQELDDGQTAHVAGFNTLLETAGRASSTYWAMAVHGHTAADERQRIRDILDVEPGSANEVAADWLGRAGRLWVVVGDREVLAPQLERLGRPVRWISAREAVHGE